MEDFNEDRAGVEPVGTEDNDPAILLPSGDDRKIASEVVGPLAPLLTIASGLLVVHRIQRLSSDVQFNKYVTPERS